MCGAASPRPAQTPSFQGVPRGTSGQAAIPSAEGRTACQTSTYGWPSTRTCGPADLGREPRLLRPRDEVVDQHAEPAPRPGGEAAHRRRQVVDAVQRLDHDPLDAQVVAPHLLDELGVVDALDPDPAGPRDPRASAPSTAIEPEAVTRGPVAAAADAAGRRATGSPSIRKPAPYPNDLRAPAPVLEHHRLLVRRHHRPAPAGLGVLDDQPGFGRDVGTGRGRRQEPDRRESAGPASGSAP